MTDTETPAPSITDNDIVFECPHCSKSLAIDKRGMGLTIQCPDCDRPIRVPTISDTQAGVEADAVAMPTEALASALEESRLHVIELTARLNELGGRREAVEKLYTAQEARMEQLRREFGNIQAALDRISTVMAEG